MSFAFADAAGPTGPDSESRHPPAASVRSKPRLLVLVATLSSIKYRAYFLSVDLSASGAGYGRNSAGRRRKCPRSAEEPVDNENLASEEALGLPVCS